jgi:hypothetical protein
MKRPQPVTVHDDAFGDGRVTLHQGRVAIVLDREQIASLIADLERLDAR